MVTMGVLAGLIMWTFLWSVRAAILLGCALFIVWCIARLVTARPLGHD